MPLTQTLSNGLTATTEDGNVFHVFQGDACVAAVALSEESELTGGDSFVIMADPRFPKSEGLHNRVKGKTYPFPLTFDVIHRWLQS